MDKQIKTGNVSVQIINLLRANYPKRMEVSEMYGLVNAAPATINYRMCALTELKVVDRVRVNKNPAYSYQLTEPFID